MEEEQDQEQVALEELGETREVESKKKTINPMILKVRDSTLGEMRQWLRSQVGNLHLT